MYADPRFPDLRVGDAERSRAESLLQDAYCVGRLDEAELDERLGQVMRAQTRSELNRSLAGLPRQHPFATPRPMAHATNPQATPLGAAAHLLALFSWVFGPLLVYAVATPGTPARREAARAFNFQLITAVVAVVVAVVGGAILPGAAVATLMVTGWLGWLVLTVMGGAKALAGVPWTNPVLKVLRLEVLKNDGR